MTILFLSRLYTPHLGGVEKHLQGLVQELSKDKKNQITIITEKYSPDLKDEEVIDGVRVMRIPLAGVGESAKKWAVWKWLARHNSLLDSADIIHVHDVMFWLYPYKLSHSSKKVYLTLHGWEGIYPLPLKNKLQKKFDSILAAGNICVGDFIAKWYGIKADFVTYGAVSDPPTHTQKLSSDKTLLFLGRLDEGTGFRECLNLFNLLNHKNNWKLVVAGDGPLKNILPQTAEFLGFVSDPEIQISKYNYVYTTGYLGILESFIQKKIVISGFSNPLKKDYLLLHPMSKYFILNSNLPDSLPEEAYNWSKAQTWTKLANLYFKLWSK